MAVSASLMAKGGAGLTAAAAAATAGTLGTLYKDDIVYFFSSEIEKINIRLTSLGLPEKCKFSKGEKTDSKECDIADEDLKKINFSNKKEGDLTIEGGATGTKLKIKKIGEKKEFPADLKFTFKDYTNNITIKNGSDTNSQISLIKNTNPEFEINEDGKLEKAWDVTSLSWEAGLKCPASEDGGDECEILDKLRVNGVDSVQKTDLLSLKSENSKKFTFLKDQEGYNQGFKFTVKDSDITLSKQGNSNSVDATLTSGSFYEVKYGDNFWYLSKKD